MGWKIAYRAYRDFAIVFHLIVFVMIFLAIYPVATRSIDILDIGKSTWSFDGRNVTIDIPIKVRNGGLYDINNMRLYLNVKNESYDFIHVDESLGNIVGGAVRTVHVKIPIDLRKIYDMESPTFYHFWSYDTFHIDFNFSLNYLFNMVYFKSSYTGDETWEPIIKSFQTYHPSLLNESGGKVRIILPYKIVTAHYLWGDAKFSGRVYGKGDVGNFNTSFKLGGKYNGEINLLFNASYAKSLITKSQNLHLQGNITFMGFKIPLNTDYRWGAPLNNLKVEVLNNGTLHYSFQNDADFGLKLKIQKDYYYNNTLMYSEVTYLNVSSGESVNRYEEINVSQPVDKVIVTIYDENSGFKYQEAVSV